jgi:hypothetical protein
METILPAVAERTGQQLAKVPSSYPYNSCRTWIIPEDVTTKLLALTQGLAALLQNLQAKS